MNWPRYLTLFVVAFGAALAATAFEQAAAGEPGCLGDCYVKAPPPLIHRTFKRRIQVEPGVYEIAREPSRYGFVREKVLLKDAEWRETPAVYKTVTVKQRVPSRNIWEKRLIKGKEVMCKVRVPGKTVLVEKEVMVAPPRRVAVSAPAYGYVERRVLLRPYKNIAIYHRARHIYTTERVAIQPEGYVLRKVRSADLWD